MYYSQTATIEELNNESSYDLFRRLNYCDDNIKNTITDILTKRIENDINVLGEVPSYLEHNNIIKFAPIINGKMDEICNEIVNNPNGNAYQLSQAALRFAEILSVEFKDKIVKFMLDRKLNYSFSDYYVFSKILYPGLANGVNVLKYAIEKYHVRSSWEGQVRNVFNMLSVNDLNEACGILKNQTPVMQTIMLSRQDISEEFVLIGLKALSKLKRSRKIVVKIRLEDIKKMSPMRKLEVIKHVTGYTRRWSYRNYGVYEGNYLPEFDITPTKEELMELLFSCSLAKTKEVQAIADWYDQYLKYMVQQREEQKAQLELEKTTNKENVL